MRIRIALTVLAAAGTLLAQQPQSKVKKAPAHDRGLIKGADLYRGYCAVCHGIDGKGGGPMAGALKTGPSDLTQLSRKNRGTFPLGSVRQMLGGGSSTPAHGSEEMPIWGPVFRAMTPNQSIATLRVDNLVHYLESIQAK
ncbi:MAG: c-type cytochrome [Bryobacteraceae bacterium]